MSAEPGPKRDEISCPSCGAHLKTSLGFIRCPECNVQLKGSSWPTTRPPAFSGIGREQAVAQPSIPQPAIQGVKTPQSPGMGAVGALRFVAILNLVGGIGIGVLVILASLVSKDASGIGGVIAGGAFVVEGILGCAVLWAIASITENLIWIRHDTGKLVYLQGNRPGPDLTQRQSP